MNTATHKLALHNAIFHPDCLHVLPRIAAESVTVR